MRRYLVQLPINCTCQPPSAPSMPVLKALVETRTKARFRAMARERGLSESELLRMVVLAVTEEDDGGGQVIKPDAERVDLTRTTVRMPRFLMDGVHERAKANGMAPSRWIAALVQSNLTRQPVMNAAELAGLQASNRELAAIGRNINQIAHALNSAFHETERVKLEKLAELNEAIEGHRAAIRQLVRASQDAWEADDGTD